MEEFGPIQEHPRGLLDLLGLKIAGRNPESMLSTLYPGLDLLEWYLNARSVTMVRALDTIAAGTVGIIGATGNNLLVPQAEWWYVHHLGITAISSTGNDVKLSPAIIVPGMNHPTSVGTATIILGSGFSGPFAAATAAAPAWLVDRPFWAPPGSEFVVWVQQAVVPAPPFQPTIRMRFTPLRV